MQSVSETSGIYQWCKSLVWMISVERGKAFCQYSPCNRGTAYVRVNILGPVSVKYLKHRIKTQTVPTTSLIIQKILFNCMLIWKIVARLGLVFGNFFFLICCCCFKEIQWTQWTLGSLKCSSEKYHQRKGGRRKVELNSSHGYEDEHNTITNKAIT